MADRRPDPPDPRASLVDSGWSEAPVPSERELPAYEDVAREALVTRVDDQIQARIAAMNYDDKTEVTSAPRAAPAPAPAAAPVKAPTAPLGSRPQRRPPPLSAPPTAPPASAPATARKPSAAPAPVAAAPLELLSAPTEERTLVDSQPPNGTQSSSPPPPPRRPSQMPPAPKPRSAPPPRRPSVPPPLPVPQLPPIPPHPLHPAGAAPAQPAAAAPQKPAAAVAAPVVVPAPLAAAAVVAQPLPPPSLPPPRPVSVPPPALPSFAPMPAAPAVPSFETAPSLGQALSARVRVVGMETPLWGVIVPLLGATAVIAALAAGLVATSTREPEGVPGAPSANAEVASAAATAAPASAPKAGDAGSVPASGSLVERARSGEASALASLEQKKPADRSVEEALGLAAGKVAQAAAAAAKLRARLAADPGLAKDPKVVADLRKFAQEAATSRDALAAMAAIPGPLSADLLYEAWTSTAERSETTELAQALLMSHDVRPKASPALAVALDLREAETCEANAAILPRAIDVGDKRAFAPLSRLLRRNGCGPTKRDDCYVCIREGDLLTKALSTVKQRREPELVRRDAPAH